MDIVDFLFFCIYAAIILIPLAICGYLAEKYDWH